MSKFKWEGCAEPGSAWTTPKPAPSAEPDTDSGKWKRKLYDEPAPSAEPEWLDVTAHLAWYRGRQSVSLDSIRDLLSRAGLAIVKASDVPSAEDKRVLEACDLFPDEVLNHAEPIPSRLRGAVSDASYAWTEAMLELRAARRAAKKGKTDG